MGIAILVVDDSLLVTELIREHFSGRGYRVFCASNGRDALAIAEREVPDLIISDINMPAMNGWDLCAAIKKTPGLSDIPFLFLTVEGEDTDVKKGIDLGAAGYLTKPFSFDELRAAVEAALAADGKDLPGAESDEPPVGDASAQTLHEVLEIFLEKRRTGTLYVEHGGTGGIVGFAGGTLAGAQFVGARGPLALLKMMTLDDARYRFTPETGPATGGFSKDAGPAYLGELHEVLPDFAGMVASLKAADPILRLAPKFAAMDTTSILDLATAGFHRAGAKKTGSRSLMGVFESLLRSLKTGAAPLGGFVADADGADVIRVLAHLVRRGIVVEKI